MSEERKPEVFAKTEAAEFAMIPEVFARTEVEFAMIGEETPKLSDGVVEIRREGRRKEVIGMAVKEGRSAVFEELMRGSGIIAYGKRYMATKKYEL